MSEVLIGILYAGLATFVVSIFLPPIIIAGPIICLSAILIVNPVSQWTDVFFGIGLLIGTVVVGRWRDKSQRLSLLGFVLGFLVVGFMDRNRDDPSA